MIVECSVPKVENAVMMVFVSIPDIGLFPGLYYKF